MVREISDKKLHDIIIDLTQKQGITMDRNGPIFYAPDPSKPDEDAVLIINTSSPKEIEIVYKTKDHLSDEFNEKIYWLALRIGERFEKEYSWMKAYIIGP